MLTNAIVTSLEAGAIVAFVAPLLGLAAAMAIRELPAPRLILSLVLLPLFIPGVSAGLATALFFHLVGVPPSLLTIAIVLDVSGKGQSRCPRFALRDREDERREERQIDQ